MRCVYIYHIPDFQENNLKKSKQAIVILHFCVVVCVDNDLALLCYSVLVHRPISNNGIYDIFFQLCARSL